MEKVSFIWKPQVHMRIYFKSRSGAYEKVIDQLTVSLRRNIRRVLLLRFAFLSIVADHWAMNSIPPTSREHYLTGQAALNIPYEDNTSADWRFSAIFLGEKTRFKIAGENFLDTSALLGEYGIRECSEVLRRYGVPIQEGAPVYAANHVRAVLDLVMSSLSRGKIPAHVTIDDTLDSPDSLRDFHEQLTILKKKITDRVTLSLLNQWEQQQ